VLQPAELTPQAVTAAVRRLLDDRGLAAGARAMQAQIAAMPDAEMVLNGLR